jgi:DHA2 family multidrug resistance protein-like MFS transporter
MCLLIALPFLLEGHLDLSVATVGLLILPFPIGVALTSPLAGRHADKHWAGLMSAGGLMLMAGVLIMLAIVITKGLAEPLIGFAMALCGIGYGLFQVPNNNVMLRNAPLDRAGAAAGMLAQCRLVGQTVGALIAALMMHLTGQSNPVALFAASALAGLAGLFALRR